MQQQMQQQQQQQIHVPAASEESIQSLMSLGFEREAVVEALRRRHNNVQHAADELLNGSSSQ